MKNIAVILAGGAGKRFGGDRPKQLLPLSDGRSVLEHAVEAFRACACIDEVLVVMHPDWLSEAADLLPGVRLVGGGRERWESSWHAIEAIIGTSKTSETSKTSASSKTSATSKTSASSSPSETTNLLLHDAARPFVSERIITDVCRALEQHEAVTVAVPATDTIYRIADTWVERGSNGGRSGVDRGLIGGRSGVERGLNDCRATVGRLSGDCRAEVGAAAHPMIAEIPDRATMMRAQTPQAFRLSLIRRAYELALQDPALQATDDCGIVHRYLPDTPIYIIEGEEANRKITFRGDLG